MMPVVHKYFSKKIAVHTFDFHYLNLPVANLFLFFGVSSFSPKGDFDGIFRILGVHRSGVPNNWQAKQTSPLPTHLILLYLHPSHVPGCFLRLTLVVHCSLMLLKYATRSHAHGPDMSMQSIYLMRTIRIINN